MRCDALDQADLPSLPPSIGVDGQHKSPNEMTPEEREHLMDGADNFKRTHPHQAATPLPTPVTQSAQAASKFHPGGRISVQMISGSYFLNVDFEADQFLDFEHMKRDELMAEFAELRPTLPYLIGCSPFHGIRRRHTLRFLRFPQAPYHEDNPAPSRDKSGRPVTGDRFQSLLGSAPAWVPSRAGVRTLGGTLIHGAPRPKDQIIEHGNVIQSISN